MPDWNTVFFDRWCPQASACVILGALALTTYLQELVTCVLGVVHPEVAKAVRTHRAANPKNLTLHILPSIG